MNKENCLYLPMGLRVIVPGTATATPSSPYVFSIDAQGDTLESIEITIPAAGFLQNAGVRIRSNEFILYPALGSVSDGNFVDVRASYGFLPTSGLNLVLPFNRKLQGTPNKITFEFYNDNAGTLAVNILVVISQEIKVPITIKPKEIEGRKDEVRYPKEAKV